MTQNDGYLIGKRQLDGLFDAVEAVIVNALDINGVSDRRSISYEELNNLIAALGIAKAGFDHRS